jgi:hypothetical protein
MECLVGITGRTSFVLLAVEDFDVVDDDCEGDVADGFGAAAAAAAVENELLYDDSIPLCM